MTTAERVCGSYTATTVTLVRYLTCMRRPGRPFSARPVLFASSCAGARVRLGPAAAPGGIRIIGPWRGRVRSRFEPCLFRHDCLLGLVAQIRKVLAFPFLDSYSFHLYHVFSMASSLPLVRPRVSAI